MQNTDNLDLAACALAVKHLVFANLVLAAIGGIDKRVMLGVVAMRDVVMDKIAPYAGNCADFFKPKSLVFEINAGSNLADIVASDRAEALPVSSVFQTQAHDVIAAVLQTGGNVHIKTEQGVIACVFYIASDLYPVFKLVRANRRCRFYWNQHKRDQKN